LSIYTKQKVKTTINIWKMEKWVEEQKEKNKRRKADADREQQIYTKMKFKKN